MASLSRLRASSICACACRCRVMSVYIATKPPPGTGLRRTSSTVPSGSVRSPT